MNYKLAIMFNYTGAAEKCQKSIEPAPARLQALDLGAGRVIYVYSEKVEESKGK